MSARGLRDPTSTAYPQEADLAPRHIMDIAECAEYIGSELDPKTWEPIMPFSEFKLPPFPVEALPPWQREFVTALSASLQTPVDLAGVLVLAVCAACVAKAVKIAPRRDWLEPLNIYTAVPLPPASRKSAVVSALTKPIERFEDEMAEQLEPIIAEAYVEKCLAEKELEKLKKTAGSTKDPDKLKEVRASATALALELMKMDVPVSPRLLAEDCTPEALTSLLHNHGGRMAIISAEGDTLDIIAGRYSEKARPGVYLKGHAGETIKVDRVGRAPESIYDASITFGLSPQPQVLQNLAENQWTRDRGMLARFLYSLPASNVGYRKIEAPEVQPGIYKAYERGLRSLLEINPIEQTGTKWKPHILDLSAEAQNVFQSFRHVVEVNLRPSGELGDLSDWGGKLCGAVSRIAGILHLAEHGITTLHVSGDTMANAIRLGKYFTEHAKAAFAYMGADRTFELAKETLVWIQANRCGPFSERDLHTAKPTKFRRAADVKAPLQLLCERNFIALAPKEQSSGPGRPKSAIYVVNPTLIPAENIQHIRQNSPITLTLNARQMGEVHAATELRIRNKEQTVNSNCTRQSDYDKTLYGVLVEYGLVGWLRKQRIRVSDWVFAAQGRAPNGCDMRIIDVPVEVKGCPPGQEYVTVGVRQWEQSSRTAKFLLYGLCTDHNSFTLCAPIPIGDVGLWERCSAKSVQPSNGDIQTDYFRLHRDALKPLLVVNQITDIAVSNANGNGDVAAQEPHAEYEEVTI